LPVLVGSLQLIAHPVLTHSVEQVVDLRRIVAPAQNDHLNLRIVDVRDAVQDRLDIVDLGLYEVLHVQVGADRAAERLLAIIESLELYRRREHGSQDNHVGVASD
jgi:hypothetical protein